MLQGRRKNDARGAAHSGGPRRVLKGRKFRSYGQIFAALIAVFALQNAHSAPPGAIISNQATLYHQPSPGVFVPVASNTVQATAAVVRSAASIEFTRVVAAGAGDYQETVGPSACLQGGSYVNLADPVLSGGTPVDPVQIHDVAATSAYNLGEPLFLRLADSDQNLDYLALDTAPVTITHEPSGDSETLRLTETGLNTGIFAAYVPSARAAAISGDCIIQGALDSSVRVSYTDPADTADTSEALASVDTVSRVFESRSGTAVDGALIELVDAVSGQPAVVYGNDGSSIFPSSLVSGSTVTDGSGANYAFGPGEYRFPVVPDGDYRLLVTPPPDYAFPSGAQIADLQLLPGAPYSLDTASFGSPFTQAGGLSFDIDLPVDPRSSTLFLQKQTTTSVAAPGDFVQYELLIENTSAQATATGVEVADRLPPGVRFVAGSARYDGTEVPDPSIGSDMRGLSFDIGVLGPGERVRVSYVVEIIGGRRDDELVNVATAYADAGIISNEAAAMIRLREDLFRSTGTIIGRVLEADCSQAVFAEEAGVANVRVYLEDGRYAVTDAGGRFHFEGLNPGTHVAQLDTFSVPAWFDIVGCDDTPGYAGDADSQFVKLSPGALLRADFYLKRKPRPEGRVDLELRNTETDSAEQVAYELEINGTGNVDIQNIDLNILLPDGVRYAPGTLRVDGQALGEPRVREQVLSLAIDDQFGNWASAVTFIADIAPQVDGELTTRAYGSFDSPIENDQRTPVAETRMIREPAETRNEGYVLDLKFAVLSDELSPQDKLQLDRVIESWQGVRDIQIGAIGHSDSQPIAERNRHLFADNYVLSQSRALSAAHYVADALRVPVGNIQVEGRGPDDPVASNATAAGRQANRRVELVLSGLRPSKPSFLEVTQASSGTQVTPTQGAIPGDDQKQTRIEFDPNEGMPASQVEPAIESLQPGMALLLPERDWGPAIASTKISVQHGPRQTISVYVNGEPVSALNFDSTIMNQSRNVAISRWKGVALNDGENDIRVVFSNADGSRAGQISRRIFYSGPPIRGELVEELSTLTADGQARPVLAVRLFDRAGGLVRAGTSGKFRVNPPYRSWWEVESDRRNDLIIVGDREPTYRVGADGIAYLELEPTTLSGEVSLNLKFEHLREQEIRTWLRPATRDWILVGFAEGTAGYNTLSDNISAAIDAGYEEEYFDDGRVAFFAKGSIRGDYLLTLAFDSARDRDETRNRFDTVIDPTAYYPLFADASEQRFEAPSQRKLYVKLERNQFVALFGDFETGLSVTDLARYDRRFNGFKSEYRGSNLGYSVFAADTNQAFQRDEIRGDGTSGLYRLSRSPIIANSDMVRIEVRNRLDSGQVLNSTRLARYVDYNLDPLNGTLFFKRPVPSRDLDFNPVYIVAEYESASTADEALVAGGRASIRLADEKVEIGLTHINDATTGAEADLTGVDLRWQIDDQTLLKAESVQTSATVSAVENRGSAQSIDVEHNGENLDIRAYIREVEEGFGLGYQSAADRGFRRVGLDARAKVSERFSIDGEAQWQQNLETEDIRNLARALMRYERNAFTASLGLTHASDQFEDGEERNSDLAEVGLQQKILDGKVTLRASSSTALGSDEAESTDFPSRLVLGAEYAMTRDVDLVAEWEDSSGAGIDSTMTRLGVRARPWTRAQANTYLTEEVTEFGPRLFANVGLMQGFEINERWTLDVGVDQSNTLSDAGSRPFDPDRELVSGSRNEDFLAIYSGAMYSADDWSANSRLEYRNSDSEERSSLLVGWYRQPTLGHGLSASLTLLRSDNISGARTTVTDAKVGWAYRRPGSQWSYLDRLDLILQDAAMTGAEQSSWRIINNFNANRRISAAMQLSLQYAFKYVRSDFDGDGYSGYTDLIGIDFRRAIRGNWDLGASTSVYHSYRSDVIDYGAGLDVGYNIADNMWLTLGYNFAGFDDSDFSQARYTAQGPYLRFSMKTDQDMLKRIAGRR